MFHTHNMVGDTVATNNIVSWGLIEIYKDRYPDQPFYVNDIIEKFEEHSIIEALLQWFELDDQDKVALAKKIQMPIEKLESTAEGIRWIYYQ